MRSSSLTLPGSDRILSPYHELEPNVCQSFPNEVLKKSALIHLLLSITTTLKISFVLLAFNRCCTRQSHIGLTIFKYSLERYFKIWDSHSLCLHLVCSDETKDKKFQNNHKFILLLKYRMCVDFNQMNKNIYTGNESVPYV